MAVSRVAGTLLRRARCRRRRFEAGEVDEWLNARPLDLDAAADVDDVGMDPEMASIEPKRGTVTRRTVGTRCSPATFGWRRDVSSSANPFRRTAQPPRRRGLDDRAPDIVTTDRVDDSPMRPR